MGKSCRQAAVYFTTQRHTWMLWKRVVLTESLWWGKGWCCVVFWLWLCGVGHRCSLVVRLVDGSVLVEGLQGASLVCWLDGY